MGGPSSEHEVSVKSGLNVLKHLDAKKYQALPVFIDTRGLALHGEYGEDGGVQGVLRHAGITYTGSHALPSALAMHKALAGKELTRAGLHVPDTLELKKGDWRKKPQEVLKPLYNHFGSRVVIKPINRGSSVGVSVVHIQKGDLGPLDAAVERAFAASKQVMAQQYIRGREVTCGVLDVRGEVHALLPTEIIPVGREFFDHVAKYDGASREVTPPERMSLALIKKIEATAVTAHRALGLRGVTRTDMIIAPGGQIYVLEVNTIPGMTEASLIPQQAKACGISFTKLLDLMIEDATELIQ